MGAAVAAAGSLAGGAAANALMGDTKAPAGGGIPGLTSSKGAGKDGTGPGYAIQVDPTIAMGYFQTAAGTQAAGYDQGLTYYLPHMDQAAKEIKAGYQAANATLTPLSFSSNQALNEQMRMLGLDPIQATYGYGDALRMGYDTLSSKLPEAGGFVGSLADQMDAAMGIQDPEARAEARQNILNSISSGVRDMRTSLQDQLQQIQKEKPAPYQIQYVQNSDEVGSMLAGLHPVPGTDMAVDLAGERERQAAYNAQMSDWNSRLSGIQDKLNAFEEYSKELTTYGQEFAGTYGDQYDRGYTGEQVMERVTNLPGYQFQLDQGTKAIERQGAAAGMLGSANTAHALQDYGQGQATSYYNQYMAYLSGITAQGAAATGQIATNQANQGSALAQIQQSIGQAKMTTEQQKAAYAAQMLAQQGQLFNDTAMFNAAAQNNSIQNAANNAAAMQRQQVASGPAYMGAALNQAGFLQNIINSNSVGQGYLASVGGGGGVNYSSPQQNWTNMMRGYI